MPSGLEQEDLDTRGVKESTSMGVIANNVVPDEPRGHPQVSNAGDGYKSLKRAVQSNARYDPFTLILENKFLRFRQFLIILEKKAPWWNVSNCEDFVYFVEFNMILLFPSFSAQDGYEGTTDEYMK